MADLAGGGATLLINLPTDQPRALLHSWLTRRISGGPSQLVLSLFAVGRAAAESVEQLRAANVRLQSLARPEDYIYRACHSRWLWLTTAAELPAFLRTSAWKTHQLDRWTCVPEPSSIIDLSERLDERFRELIGTRVPPLDLRTQAATRSPVRQQPAGKRLDEAARSTPVSHLHNRTRVQARWRYPI